MPPATVLQNKLIPKSDPYGYIENVSFIFFSVFFSSSLKLGLYNLSFCGVKSVLLHEFGGEFPPQSHGAFILCFAQL